MRHLRRLLALALGLGAALLQASPPAPGHPLLGTWQLRLPGVSECVETYEILPDGTTHTKSAEEETVSEYEISAVPNEKGYYVFVDTVKKSNGKPDCSGRVTPVGEPVTLYLAPLRGGYLVCFDPALQRCLGPMMRIGKPPAASP